MITVIITVIITTHLTLGYRGDGIGNMETPEKQSESADFGKHFASMYDGSMVGAGAVVFAVMGYVIAKARPDRISGEFYVDLNPVLLGAIFGEKAVEVEKAIRFLSGPDKDSRTEGHEGKRLVRQGQFTYWVVNGKKYRELGAREARMRKNREAQARYRAKKKHGALRGERLGTVAHEDVERGISTKEEFRRSMDGGNGEIRFEQEEGQ